MGYSAGMAEGGVEIELGAQERRLYDRWRRRLRPVPPGASSDLRDVLLLLPDLLVLIARLMRDGRVALSDRIFALLGFAYVISPVDFVPSFIFGPIGVLDDFAVVAWTLSRLLNRVHPDIIRFHWSGQGDALRAIQRVCDWFERRRSTS